MFETWPLDPTLPPLEVDPREPIAIVRPIDKPADEDGPAEQLYTELASDPAALKEYARAHEIGMLVAPTFMRTTLTESEDTARIHQEKYPTELQRSRDMGKDLRREAKRLEELAEAIHNSRHDALTGLYNRAALDGIMANLQKASQARRKGDARPPELSVILGDIDLFKRVNDTYGHPAGDTVLVETARRLSGSLRDGDYAIRFGGEEMLFLLNGANDAEATQIAELLRISLSESPIKLQDGTEITVSASFGVARLDVFDLADSTSKADLALYAAKRGDQDRVGRNQVVQYDPAKHLPSTD